MDTTTAIIIIVVLVIVLAGAAVTIGLDDGRLASHIILM